MSTIYDNWERLVAATIKRVQFREMALAPPSRESSFSSRLSDTTFASSNRHDEFYEKKPGISDFQIIGSAEPGSRLLACGYPANGTILCMFQWVRYHPDGSAQFIKEATNPEYLVTADDVGTHIVAEVIPMDYQERQGDLVRAFANKRNTVECGKEMKETIEEYLSEGRATFKVLILIKKFRSSKWEPATLSTKRDSGFQVMVERKQRVVIEEKYSENLTITIPGELSTEFHLKCNRLSYSFRSTSNRMREIIVLTIRTFQNKVYLRSQPGVTQVEVHTKSNDEKKISEGITFENGLVSSSERHEPGNIRSSSDKELSVNWTSKASTELIIMDGLNPSSSPDRPPLFRELSSSFSEGADDDPTPRIEGLFIFGEAFPGSQLQACGYSINGTTSCNFEWLRHLEDGSFIYIDGAKQPNYLITADDIDTYLAIEVQPLDDRKRKGELVKVFANEHRKITCDPEMQNCIEKTLYKGYASYNLYLSRNGFHGIWEPAMLIIKRDGYEIKCTGLSDFLVAYKFSPSTIVCIPHQSPTEFSIFDSQGKICNMKVDDSITGINNSRDTTVLSMRLFIIKAGDKMKGKKKGLLFNI